MRTHGSAGQLEARRIRAVRMVVEEDRSLAEVARSVRVHYRTLTRWMKKFRECGEEGLAAKPHPGRASFLSDEERDDLCDRLVEGALAQGFDTDLWTCPRVKELIEREYGVSYHVDHIPYLLRTLGFSPQKPQRRAIERNETDIGTWIHRDWPRIKKRRHNSAPTSCLPTKPAS